MSDQAELYESEAKYAQSEAIFTKVLEARRRVLGPRHPDTLESLASLARVRIQLQNWGAAEPLAREAVTAYQKTASNDWKRYDAESVLGASLAGQHKYAEAEPLLVSGYEGMVQREMLIPAGYRSNLEQVGQRLVQLYQAWDKPKKAAEWKQQLRSIKTQVPQ
jgi:hypothetical protein